ncbi:MULTISPECIES: TetR/AcrR family transcriptional regulator [unclassified Streptomyces]|uniref:TetR/AcrR family transcriptional regulator n=1 Tax=unclassified Streptomyces TaxID=2593676 RepID=UPI0022B728BF|nr:MULTISPECIES: TetR/AcrR family transcriptional regulator [unclassified Streptomyces]MCZ7415620.1 TetR/AcrR family transcriptional regulator [Streptomyces sp. WMMC897]MCZ7434568.1 TetR/AcrR family transcriptional regulator [Streptomyces sp. WMMC1477]
MSPRSASVNEELRRRSRERLLQATVELVGERGYEATTLGDIAGRAGAARGLISYYFPGKRQLLQSAVHRLMHRTLSAALDAQPRPSGPDAGREMLARAIDAVLGLTRTHPTLMRTHMAGILQQEGFVQCEEQQRLAAELRRAMEGYGSTDLDTDYPLLRALLMGAVVAALLPGIPMPLPRLRAELFSRYGLDWRLGYPPGDEPPGGSRPLRLVRGDCRCEEPGARDGTGGPPQNAPRR